MQRIFFLYLCCLFGLSSIAQNNSGIIEYEETHRFEREEGHPRYDREGPRERKRRKLLYFNQTASLFKDKPRDPNEVRPEGERRRGRRGRGRRNRNHVYHKNMATGVTHEQRDIMGKTFLIKEEDLQHEWKMTGEQTSILDYMCMKATTIVDSIEISAWFTPQIPISIGPSSYHTLPGAVLKVESADGRRTIIASKVSFEEVNEDELKQPDKGEKVNQEEFDKIRAEKREEMRQMYGDRPNRRMPRGRGR